MTDRAGRMVVLKRTVVAKRCRLPDGLTVGGDPAEDRRRFHLTERGTGLVIPAMLGSRCTMALMPSAGVAE